MVERARQSTNQPLLLLLLCFLLVKNSLWAWDASATRRLRSFPSWTHLSTSWRSCIGTYKVRVRFSSFHVRRATSWRGPSWAHRHRGFPHRFLVIFRDAWTKGFIFRILSRACLPCLFVIRGRTINISINTSHIFVNKKSSIAKKYFGVHGLDRKKTRLKRVRIAEKNHSSLLTKTCQVLLGLG